MTDRIQQITSPVVSGQPSVTLMSQMRASETDSRSRNFVSWKALEPPLFQPNTTGKFKSVLLSKVNQLSVLPHALIIFNHADKHASYEAKQYVMEVLKASGYYY